MARPDLGRGFWATAWARLRRDRVGLVALGVLLTIAALSIAAPTIAAELLHTDPARFMRTPSGRIATLQPPGPGYPLGTDELGRDALTRLLFAGQTSLLLGSMVALVSVGFGAPLGLLAAYFGGWVDDLVNALVQLLLNIPLILLLIALSVLFTPNVWQLGPIFRLFFWPGA